MRPTRWAWACVYSTTTENCSWSRNAMAQQQSGTSGRSQQDCSIPGNTFLLQPSGKCRRKRCQPHPTYADPHVCCAGGASLNASPQVACTQQSTASFIEDIAVVGIGRTCVATQLTCIIKRHVFSDDSNTAPPSMQSKQNQILDVAIYPGLQDFTNLGLSPGRCSPTPCSAQLNVHLLALRPCALEALSGSCMQGQPWGSHCHQS